MKRVVGEVLVHMVSADDPYGFIRRVKEFREAFGGDD